MEHCLRDWLHQWERAKGCKWKSNGLQRRRRSRSRKRWRRRRKRRSSGGNGKKCDDLCMRYAAPPSVPTALQPSCCLHLLSGGQDGEDGDDDAEDIGDDDVKEGEEEDNERDVEVEGGANLTAAKLPAAFLIRGRDSRAPATSCAPIGDAFGT